MSKRIPFDLLGWFLIILVIVAGAALVSAPKSPLTTADKAYYLTEKDANFVRPGLVFKVISADIASDGTIKTRFRIEDPKGLPLDREGIQTPGAVSVSLIAATIPNGQTQYTAYTTRVQTSPINGVSATQAAADSGGTFDKVADGEYVYTFRTKAPSSVDRTATHTIGIYGSRNLGEFDLGTDFASVVYSFLPAGGKVTTVRDVVKTSSCNKCHDELAFHGGSRKGVELCVLCHTPQTTDPDTGNTVNLPVMVHKIHAGATLPSVKAGGKYQIIGFNQNVSDWSEVNYPADVRNCQTCHEQGPGAASQAMNVYKPNRAACGACHDDVNFATGANHADLPQISDNQCSQCHTVQGELEFDVSIRGAHTVPQQSTMLTGLQYDLIKVDDGTAGKKPTVTFKLSDKDGNPLDFSAMNRLAFTLGGPTTDYTMGDHGYVAEQVAAADLKGGPGTYTYTFKTAIPANATGTFTIGIEGRRVETVLPGTKKQMSIQYGAKQGKVINFSVDGTPAQPRRKVVALEKCNACHYNLTLHGANRNAIEQCVVCHNPVENDGARRPASANPVQSVDFRTLIHKIHMGRELANEKFIVYGFGGSLNDFSDVGFPAMSKTGEIGNLRACDMCHVNGSEHLPLRDDLANVVNPRARINPAGPATTACLACHNSKSAASHALANTSALGESCATCHSETSEFSVSKVHAQ